jgi:hypothetical protein
VLDLELVALNRLGLAVDNTDKISVITSATSRIDFEVNGVAGSHTQLAGIADEGSSRFVFCQCFVSLHKAHSEAKYQ